MLEQSRNLSVIINIHILSSRFLGQTGHGQDIAGKRYDKACSGGDSEFSYGYGKACGTTNLCGIIREGVLGFGHADGHFVKAEFLDFGELFLCCRGEGDAVSAVDFLGGGIGALCDYAANILHFGKYPAGQGR